MFTRENIHHAYAIQGDKKTVCPHLFKLIENVLDIRIHGSPDFFYQEYESFGIDDGRRVKDMQSNRAFTEGRKIFVIATESITNEAQNSLLKVFEEPTKDTHFFVIMPSLSRLLPTFKSRVRIVIHDSLLSVDTKDAEDFLKANIPGRLRILKEIIETKDKSSATEFLKSIAFSINKDGIKDTSSTNPGRLKVVSDALLQIQDRSSSVKLIMENLALTI